MKKLSVITFAITVLVFVNISANAQNNGSRNMQKRDRGGQYGNGNQNQQNDERSSQYNSRSNENEQYSDRNEGNNRSNREEQYGRREENLRSDNRMVLNYRRHRDNYRRQEYKHDCSSRSFYRNNY